MSNHTPFRFYVARNYQSSKVIDKYSSVIYLNRKKGYGCYKLYNDIFFVFLCYLKSTLPTMCLSIV